MWEVQDRWVAKDEADWMPSTGMGREEGMSSDKELLLRCWYGKGVGRWCWHSIAGTCMTRAEMLGGGAVTEVYQ